MAMDTGSKNALVIGFIILVIVVLGLLFFSGRDDRNGFEKVGDAIGELPRGADEATEQLEDNTPAEKAADAVDDAVEDAKQDAREIREDITNEDTNR